MDNFELLREALLEKKEVKVILFFHNHESNSYFSLYTSGLQKKEDGQTEKQFENELLQTFKKINKDVLQVNVYPVSFNKTYVGRVYLRSEESGKNFIVDYVTKRDLLCKYFRDRNRIAFNINVDDKTLKKIKQAEKKANQIAIGIKKSEESYKKSKKPNPAINQMPLPVGPIGIPGIPGMPFVGASINPIGVGMMPPSVGLMGQNKGVMASNMMPMGSGNIPPMGGMMNIAPQMGENPKGKLDLALRDKEKFFKMQANTAKRILLQPLKYVIEQSGVPKAQVNVISEKILKEDITEIFKCLESPEEIKKRAAK